MKKKEKLIVDVRKNNLAKKRLLLFPHAGGGVSQYRFLSEHIRSDTDIRCMQLPGREEKYGHNLLFRLDDVLGWLENEMKANTDKPYVLFGFSLGARIAYEFASLALSCGLPAPICLIVGGARPPQLSSGDSMYSLPEKEFIRMMKEIGGTSEEILHNPDLLKFILPKLRADFELADTAKQVRDHQVFDFPITVLGGESDSSVSVEDLRCWGSITDNTFAIQVFPGGHFFIDQNINEIASLINLTLDIGGA